MLGFSKQSSQFSCSFPWDVLGSTELLKGDPTWQDAKVPLHP
jgi:hypothetical protein